MVPQPDGDDLSVGVILPGNVAYKDSNKWKRMLKPILASFMKPHARPSSFLVLLILLLTVAACSKTPDGTSEPQATTTTEPSAHQNNAETAQHYDGIGVVVSFMADKKFVNINHETIPDFMDAMTMPFEVKDPTLLEGIQEGDSIAFRFTAADGIKSIQKIE